MLETGIANILHSVPQGTHQVTFGFYLLPVTFSSLFHSLRNKGGELKGKKKKTQPKTLSVRSLLNYSGLLWR